jgi:hypothetical protein
MKAILEFDLNDSFEEKAHVRAINATKAYLALHDMAELLRNDRKYGEGKYHELETQFWNLVRDRGIDLDDLD